VDTVALTGLFTIIAVALMTPGPNALTCFAHGGLFGARSNIKLILGMVIGLVSLELSIGLVVDALSESNTALQVLHWIGMIFLAVMVVIMFRVNPKTIETKGVDSLLGIKAGITMQFVNGKEWAFIILIMSKFIESFGGGLTGIAVIVFITVSVCTLAMVAWTLAGTRLDNIFSDEVKGPRIFKTCGVLLGFLWIAFLIQGPVTGLP